MAKSLLQVKGKKKVVRVSKSVEYINNLKYYGEEPVFKGPLTTSQYSSALTWYNYMCTVDDARSYLETWFKQENRIAELKRLKSVPDVWISTTCGWIARMMTKGYEIPESESYSPKRFFETRLLEMFSKAVVSNVSDTARVSIQDRVKERVSDIIGDVEALLDKGDPISMYEWLQKNEIPAAHAKKIAEYYMPLREEYHYAITVDKEGYERYTKNELKIKFSTIHNIIEDCERFSGNVKKARAPRKKKAPTADKLLKFFQYQKESNEYKLQSISPESILGAQELWTFNTKYKTLTVFRAHSHAGISVHRTSIVNYDTAASVTKRIGRKPEEYIKRVLSGGKIVLRKLMEEIKSDNIALADRINTNVILLKVVR